DGSLEASGAVQWVNGVPNGTVVVEIVPAKGNPPASSQPTNLRLTSGVLLVMPNPDPKTPLNVAINRLSFNAADQGIAGDHLSMSASFNQLSPLVSLENQLASVDS